MTLSSIILLIWLLHCRWRRMILQVLKIVLWRIRFCLYFFITVYLFFLYGCLTVEINKKKKKKKKKSPQENKVQYCSSWLRNYSFPVFNLLRKRKNQVNRFFLRFKINIRRWNSSTHNSRPGFYWINKLDWLDEKRILSE